MTAYRFGKHPPKVDYRTLRLKNYLTSAIPAPPASYSVLNDVYAKLHTTDPTRLFPMDGNGVCLPLLDISHPRSIH